jgi:thiol-disulfide isomerase/thioredoxin
VVRSFGGNVRYVVENYGSSALAKKFGVTRYPAIFVEDVLVAKPKDFGFYGKGEGGGEGRYTPWKDARSHEKYRSDLKRMIELVLADEKETLREEKAAEEALTAELKKIPGFQLKDLSGKPVTHESLAGKVVLVEFWATWCPPCRGTLAWLGEIQKKYGDRLVVLAIAVESEETDVKELIKGLNAPLVWAMGTAEVAQAFGDISAVPTLYLFDESGATAGIFYGAPPDLHATAEDLLQKVAKDAKN